MMRSLQWPESPVARWVGVKLSAALLGLFMATGAEAASFCEPGPGDRPETGLQGAIPLAERTAPGGFQGFWCGARRVAQHALFNRGSFGDVQFIGHCAYASMRDPSDLNAPTTGTAVLDVRVPSEPTFVQMLRTPAMIRAYSALELQGTLLVGAFKDFGPNGTNPLDVYDVSGDCLQPRLLSTSNVQSGNHDGWLTPDTKTYYGVPFGGNDIRTDPTRIDIHVTDLSDPSNPKPLMTWNRLQLPPEAYERTKAARNFHDASTNDKGTRLYLALYGGLAPLGGGGSEASRCANGLLILDSSEVAMRRPNPQLRYVSFLSWCDQQIDPDFGDGSSAAAHATEYVIHENGKEYIVTTDEGSALIGNPRGVCDQRTYARMIDISDERNPRVVGTFKPDVNKPENCAANLAADTIGGMVHYVGFDDRYKMRLVIYASATHGIRVVDWRDPAHPKEIAYYVKERHPTSPATSIDFTRPDPRYDAANCLIYTGWNQGGLVSIELTNPEYNPCMRRRASGSAWLPDASGRGRIQVAFDAQRAVTGPMGTLRLADVPAGVDIRMTQFTALGSVRNGCGDVPATASTVQFEGSGTYNDTRASFRVCIQDNGDGSRGATPDRFHLTCTAGCSYTASGLVEAGNLVVRQQ